MPVRHPEPTKSSIQDLMGYWNNPPTGGQHDKRLKHSEIIIYDLFLTFVFRVSNLMSNNGILKPIRQAQGVSEIESQVQDDSRNEEHIFQRSKVSWF